MDPLRPARGARLIVNARSRRGCGVVLVVVVGDIEREPSQLVNLVGQLYAESYLERGHVMVHASAVRGDRSIAFAARSRAGKSTMALALLPP